MPRARRLFTPLAAYGRIPPVAGRHIYLGATDGRRHNRPLGAYSRWRRRANILSSRDLNYYQLYASVKSASRVVSDAVQCAKMCPCSNPAWAHFWSVGIQTVRTHFATHELDMNKIQRPCSSIYTRRDFPFCFKFSGNVLACLRKKPS